MKIRLLSVTLLMELVIIQCLASNMLSRRIVENLSEKRCDLLGTSIAISQGMEKYMNKSLETKFSSTDVGRKLVVYKDTYQLLKSVADGKLASAVKSSLCLVTAAEVEHQKQMVQIIGLVKSFKIKDRKLIVLDDTLYSIFLTNMTINFPVIIIRRIKGMHKHYIG